MDYSFNCGFYNIIKLFIIMTKEIKCTCKNEFQDKLYGKGMRVHNECGANKGKTTGWKCTVCGNIVKS